MTEPVRTVGLWEIGRHKAGGWAQWYVRNVNSSAVGLVDYDDAHDAGLPDNLYRFTADDVDLMREIVWRMIPKRGG